MEKDKKITEEMIEEFKTQQSIDIVDELVRILQEEINIAVEKEKKIKNE
jgi:hypothetical protein